MLLTFQISDFQLTPKSQIKVSDQIIPKRLLEITPTNITSEANKKQRKCFLNSDDNQEDDELVRSFNNNDANNDVLEFEVDEVDTYVIQFLALLIEI